MGDAPKGGLLRNPLHIAGLRTVDGKLTNLIGGNWKVVYTDAEGNVTELALGASGTVLTSNGAASAPSWGTPTGVDMLNVMVTPFSRHSIGVDLAAISATTPGSATWPTANLAIYVPFVIDQSVTVVKMFWLNGAAVSGNVDVGIYNESGTKQVSIGSTAQSGTNAIQEVNIADTALAAGRYYLALACDNTTATFIRSQSAVTGADVASLKAQGMAQQASAFALPASATFAVAANNYVPIFGASLRTLVA